MHKRGEIGFYPFLLETGISAARHHSKKATTEVIAFSEEYYEKLSLLPYQNFKIVARTLFAHICKSSRPSAPSSMASLTRSG